MNKITLHLLFLGLITLASAASLKAQASACMPRSWTHHRSNMLTGREDHRTGWLTAQMTARFRCDCDAGCRSTCTASFKPRSRRCAESPRSAVSVGYVHKTYAKNKVVNGSKPWAIDRRAGGADCGANYGCFAKRCLLGSCGSLAAQVSVVPVGVGLSIIFTPTSPVIHDLQLDQPFQCDRCVTSAELARDYPAIVDVIQPPQDNMLGWLEICNIRCSGAQCAGSVCWESCTTTCNYY